MTCRPCFFRPHLLLLLVMLAGCGRVDRIPTASVAPGSGPQMDEVHGGLGLGVAFGLALPSRFSLGVGYDRLFASSDVGDASGSIEYDLPANAFRGFFQYSLPSAGMSGAYLGSSLGLVTEAGSATVSISGQGSVKGDLKGTGALFELFAGGDWWAAPQFALSGSAGYRYAKIGETKINGSTAYLPNGEKESIDYSGIFARAGIKVALVK